MANKPVISVILPVFNAANYVGGAIQSILAQSFIHFELLIIDDGSTDESLQAVRSAVAGDQRCVVTTRENRGLVATCNEGVAQARGTFIFRMDADDVAHPDRFAKQMSYLDRHPECIALGTRAMLADESLMPIIESFTNVSHEEIDAQNLRGEGSGICHPSVAIRRDAVVAVGGYRKEFEWAEDLDLFLRMAEIGRLANLPDVLITYRQHASSVGYSKRSLQRTRTAQAVRDALSRRGAIGRQDEAGPNGSAGVEQIVPTDYQSLGDIHRNWAWLALIGGHPRTARKHAWRALISEPTRKENLRLIACAIRGH